MPPEGTVIHTIRLHTGRAGIEVVVAARYLEDVHDFERRAAVVDEAIETLREYLRDVRR